MRAKVHRPERLFRHGIVQRQLAKRAAMDGEPKRQEPEIMPPVPEVAPGRRAPEIPPNKDTPEKNVPIQGGS